MTTGLIAIAGIVFIIVLAAAYFTLPIWRELNQISGKIGEPDYSGLTGSSDFGMQSFRIESRNETATDNESKNKAA